MTGEGDQSKLHGILSTLLREHAGKRANGRVASDRTMTAYGEVLRKCFNDLHELGYRIQNPRNLTEQHVSALCNHWHTDGKAVTTMQDALSKLRRFGEWIGKPRMVKSLWTYLPDVPRDQLKVVKAATQSKSWTERGINVAEKIREADQIDERFGLMLRLELAFGLRRKEVIHTRPWKADQGDKFVVYPGESKTGRPRDIYLEIEEQRAVLDYVKSKLGKHEHLGWATRRDGKPATYKYNLGRYERLMAKIGITKENAGVTGHGLRAQFAENAAIIAGLLSPTLGGSKGQMDRDELNLRRMWVSEMLGHSRLNITDPYYGGFGRRGRIDPPDQRMLNISRALVHLTEDVLSPVPPQQMEDCAKMLIELEGIGVSLTLRQIFVLWKVHSTRHASPWVGSPSGVLAAIEAAAIRLDKHMTHRKANHELF